MDNVNNARPSAAPEEARTNRSSFLGRLFNWNRKVVDPAHYNAMLKNLEHRLQVAHEKGDQHLISLLEAERNQIV